MKPVIIPRAQFLKARFAREDEELLRSFLRALVGDKADRQRPDASAPRRRRDNPKGRAS